LAQPSRALWLLRGRTAPEPEAPAAAPSDWDLARVRRRLERGLVQSGLLVRRAGFLCLLAEATVAFRERGATAARCLTISAGAIRERGEIDGVMAIARGPAPAPRTRHERQACFDA